MEKNQHVRWLALALTAGWLTSCSSVSPDGKQVRFHEGAAANVVVRFFSWDTIHITRPDTRENGFLPILDRESVGHEIDRATVGRDLAVVVMGYFFSTSQEAQMFEDWKTILGERGFHRLVLLRAGSKPDIDGLIVVRDSAIAAAHDQPGNAATTLAAIPPATGADVADSSGNSLR